VLVDSIDDLCCRNIILLENDPPIPKLPGNGLDVLDLEPVGAENSVTSCDLHIFV
jgi:hypothetical protein